MSRKKSRGPIIFLAMMAVALGTTTAVVMTGGTRVAPSSVSTAESDSKKSDKVTNYTPKFDDKGNFRLEGKTENSKPGSIQLEVDAVNSYIAKIPAVPKAAKLVSVKMDGTIALLNFNKDFNAGYGTEDEQSIVNGILVTLAQFPHIKRAQFLIDGKPMQGLGNIDLSEPQDVIQPGDLGKEEEETSSASDPSKP